ncbi:homoserine O-succinyltransferase MetX [Maricaulis sp. CAU 1757]
MSLALATPPRLDGLDLNAQLDLPNDTAVIVHGHVTDPANAPALVVLGGISAHRHVASSPAQIGWWAQQAGPDRAIDTTRHRILSLNYLGSELSPCPSTEDQALAVLALMDAAGIARARIVGASYGGMTALALAARAPDRVDGVIAISAADRAGASARAWRSIQRAIVEQALEYGDGEAGLDLARRLAMTTYRTPAELEARFDAPEPGSRDAAGVTAWLEARGKAYADSVCPHDFLALSRSLDTHRVDVSRIACPVTYVAIHEDRLVPANQIAETAGRTPDGRLVSLSSLYGHDAFLKETGRIGAILADWLQR